MSKSNLPAVPAAPQAETWKEKLANTLGRVTDHFIDLDPIEQARRNAEGKIIKAKAQAQADIIKEEALAVRAGIRLRNRELRRQKNIEAITDEALKALPPPSEPVSQTPVSDDFVEQFFEECQDISDVDMRKMWGRLMAGEIARPGSFHPATMRVLKYMTKKDAELFSKLCSFKMRVVNEDIPIVFDTEHEIYTKNGINFSSLTHLETLGLITFSGIANYQKKGMPTYFHMRYGDTLYFASLTANPPNFIIGRAMFTQAGMQLASLTQSPAIPEFPEYFCSQWEKMKQAGVSTSPPQVPQQPT